LKRATDLGAKVQFRAAPIDVALREDRAELKLDNASTVAGRIVLIADGCASRTAELAQLDTAAALRNAACCFATLPARRAKPGVELVIGQGRAPQLIVIVRRTETIRLMLLTRDFATPA